MYVVEFIDRNILDEANIQQCGEELARLAETDPHTPLLLRFCNVDHLSSAAIGALITLNNKTAKNGGFLALTEIDSQIYDVFVITTLRYVLRIFETLDSAMQYAEVWQNQEPRVIEGTPIRIAGRTVLQASDGALYTWLGSRYVQPKEHQMAITVRGRVIPKAIASLCSTAVFPPDSEAGTTSISFVDVQFKL